MAVSTAAKSSIKLGTGEFVNVTHTDGRTWQGVQLEKGEGGKVKLVTGGRGRPPMLAKGDIAKVTKGRAPAKTESAPASKPAARKTATKSATAKPARKTASKSATAPVAKKRGRPVGSKNSTAPAAAKPVAKKRRRVAK